MRVDTEIKVLGFEILTKHLGLVEAERFVTLIQRERFDYTKWRQTLFAGMSVARGDAVIMMDGDLQHPPDLVPSMITEWRNGAEVVNTTRKEDTELPWLKRVTSTIFYSIFSYLTNLSLRPGHSDFRLLNRKVLDKLLEFPEKSLFLRGLVSWLGYRTIDLSFTPGKRHFGETGYSFKRMFSLALDAIFSFSVVPLRLSIAVGAIMLAISFFYGIYAVLIRFIYVSDRSSSLAPGWASIIVFILSIGFLPNFGSADKLKIDFFEGMAYFPNKLDVLPSLHQQPNHFGVVLFQIVYSNQQLVFYGFNLFDVG